VKKRFSFFLVLLLALSTFLAACGGGKDNNNAQGGQGGEKPAEKKEQVLNLLDSSEIPTLDSALATDQVSFIVLNNVMEGLYRLGKDNKPVPGVAESYEVSQDGKTYTFKLRKDAKWSNGDPVTAHDFEFAWKRVLDPKTKSEYAYIMYDIKNAEEANTGKVPLDQVGVKALDDYTLKVELKNPVPYFVGLTAFGTFMPQNEKFVKAQGEKYGLEANTTLYNGPFVLSEWKHEQGWTYTKNPNYWDKDTVKLEKVNVKVVKDTATAVNLYETKQADRVGLTAEFVDKYKNDKNFHTKLDPSLFWLRMNTKKEPLNNVNARKAIAMAIDTQAMVDTLLNNGSIPAKFTVPKDFVTGPDGKDFRDVNGDLVNYNPDEAKKLWEQAKKELGKDKFTLELLNYDDDNAKKIGEYVKAQLEQNLPGLTINIKQQPFAQKLKLESNMQYDLSFSGWGPDYQDPMTFLQLWTSTSPHNETGWSNAEYDKLIKDAQTTLANDQQARWDAMLKAEKIVFEEMPIAPLYQRGAAYLQREYVKDFVTHTFGADYSLKWAYVE
jgi:oligopeptide transport system substrate-binding protein